MIPERVLQIAADIRANAKMFHMKQIGSPGCGSPGCIIGFCALRDPEADNLRAKGRFEGYDSEFAATHLDISDRVARVLFTPGATWLSGTDRPVWIYYHEPGEPGYITPEHAAACLEHFAETGVVDWDATDPNHKWDPDDDAIPAEEDPDDLHIVDGDLP